MKFWEALGGTFLVATIVSISTVFFSTLAGYSFSKLRFRGRNALLMLVVATMTIPQQLSVVPLYIMANKAGLFGSLWAVIIPGLVSAFGVFWMTQYIGDALRQIEHEDIPRACRLMYGTTLLALLLGCAVRLLIFSL